MNIRRYFYVIMLVYFFAHTSGFSQQSEYITGRLFDAKTQEPIAFASIRIKDRALGIISNVDGSFKIPLKYKEYGEIIEISSMGYQTKEIPISELGIDVLNILKIESSAVDLNEVVVVAKDKSKKNLSAKQIVQKAIDAIPRNYPLNAFSTVGYYRDYQFKDDEYLNLNEAILEVFDQGFDQLDDTTFKTILFNYGLNKNFKQDSMARASYDYSTMRKIIKKAHLDSYGGNEFRILRIHDAIRNYNVGSYDFIGKLRTDLIKNHHFLRSSDSSIENEALYTVKFSLLKGNYSAHGMIYISKIDFAIYKLEYTMYGRKIKKGAKKNKHGNRQNVIFDITTDYRKRHGKMYLNYISFQNSFTLNRPPFFKVVDTYVNVDGDHGQQFIAVEFSSDPEKSSALLARNYAIKFKNKKIKIRTIQRLKKKVFLYPAMTDEEFSEMALDFYEALNNGTDTNEVIDIKIKNVRDTNGHLINEWTESEYQQFREFFPQRFKPKSRVTLNGPFMNKEKAIFKNQPILRPDDFDDYWMNTPLKEIKN